VRLQGEGFNSPAKRPPTLSNARTQKSSRRCARETDSNLKETAAMHWHTVRFDASENRVEIYRHADDMLDGEPLILIDAGIDKFGQTPTGAEQLATWLGRIVLSDNPAARRALGLE
jgi:hypothetical protein